MIKLITHVLVFAVGAGAGVYWGVNHPSQAQHIADMEQARIDQARLQASKLGNQPMQPQPASP